MKYREPSRLGQTVRELILMPFGLISGLLFAAEAESNLESLYDSASSAAKGELR